MEKRACFHGRDAPDRAAIAQWLDQLAASTGDGRFRHAGSILRAPPAGRPLCADDPLVTEVQWLVETGRAKKIEVAARMVAPAARPVPCGGPTSVFRN